MSQDLHAALTARIEELERIARACLDEAPGDWRPEHHDEERYEVQAWDGGPDAVIMVTSSLVDARHIATWDPTAVLRGLAEDRDILRRHQRVPLDDEDCRCGWVLAECPERLSLARRHGIEVPS